MPHELRLGSLKDEVNYVGSRSDAAGLTRLPPPHDVPTVSRTALALLRGWHRTDLKLDDLLRLSKTSEDEQELLSKEAMGGQVVVGSSDLTRKVRLQSAEHVFHYSISDNR